MDLAIATKFVGGPEVALSIRYRGISGGENRYVVCDAPALLWGDRGVPHIAVTELALGNGARPDPVGCTHNGMNEGNDM